MVVAVVAIGAVHVAVFVMTVVVVVIAVGAMHVPARCLGAVLVHGRPFIEK